MKNKTKLEKTLKKELTKKQREGIIKASATRRYNLLQAQDTNEYWENLAYKKMCRMMDKRGY